MVESKTILDWETLYYALRAAAESNLNTYRIDEHLFVIHEDWGHAELFYEDEFAKEDFDDYGITIMCCEDEYEHTGECASIILERYDKWLDRQVTSVDTIFDAHCWEQAKPFFYGIESNLERAVFQNCVWGWEGMQYSLQTLLDNEWNYGLSVERTKELWRIAYWWVAEGCMEQEG